MRRLSLRLRNDDGGYGLVTKLLHWLTVAALVAQFTIGYLLEDDSGRGRGRGRGRGGESGHGRGRGGDDDVDLGFASGDDGLLTMHVVVGVSILALAIIRLLWRRNTPLPPWAPALSSAEKVFASWTERVLYLSLFLIPLTGLSLLLISDDLLFAHIATHVLFFAALAAHLGLVLKHQFIDRDNLLGRMT